MVADQLDYVVGVDPHRDEHALGIVDVRSGVVAFEAFVAADSGGVRRPARCGGGKYGGSAGVAVEGAAPTGPV